MKSTILMYTKVYIEQKSKKPRQKFFFSSHFQVYICMGTPPFEEKKIFWAYLWDMIIVGFAITALLLGGYSVLYVLKC